MSQFKVYYVSKYSLLFLYRKVVLNNKSKMLEGFSDVFGCVVQTHTKETIDFNCFYIENLQKDLKCI